MLKSIMLSLLVMGSPAAAAVTAYTSGAKASSTGYDSLLNPIATCSDSGAASASCKSSYAVVSAAVLLDRVDGVDTGFISATGSFDPNLTTEERGGGEASAFYEFTIDTESLYDFQNYSFVDDFGSIKSPGPSQSPFDGFTAITGSILSSVNDTYYRGQYRLSAGTYRIDTLANSAVSGFGDPDIFFYRGGSGLNQGVRFSITDIASLPPAVPEPASWAMLIVGFGSIGAMTRRSRRQKFLTATC